MELLLISHEDSRLPIVDLARTLADMTKQEKIFPEDISIDLIHENLTGKHPLLCSGLLCIYSIFVLLIGRGCNDGAGSPDSI